MAEVAEPITDDESVEADTAAPSEAADVAGETVDVDATDEVDATDADQSETMTAEMADTETAVTDVTEPEMTTAEMADAETAAPSEGMEATDDLPLDEQDDLLDEDIPMEVHGSGSLTDLDPFASSDAESAD